MFQRLGKWSLDWLERATPWTNVYGAGRSLIALAHLITFVVCSSTTLFHPVIGASEVPYGDGIARYGLFYLLRDHLDAARWLAAAALLLAVIGWRPRWTGALHAYVAWSFNNNASMIEGGEQVAQILALLLVPVTLTDPRKWHWDPAPNMPIDGEPAIFRKLTGALFLVAIRMQVCGIYLHAGTGKLSVQAWADGTAMYYFVSNHTFGPAPWLRPMALWICDHGALLTCMTWAPLLVEVALAAGLVADKRWWTPFLLAGLSLHAGIALLHGLVSFALIMMGALVLYMRPKDRPFVSPRGLWRSLARMHFTIAPFAPKRRARPWEATAR